jgi:hypothetical protein
MAKVVARPIQSFMRLSYIPLTIFSTSKERDSTLIFTVKILENSFTHTLSAFGPANLN